MPKIKRPYDRPRPYKSKLRPPPTLTSKGALGWYDPEADVWGEIRADIEAYKNTPMADLSEPFGRFTLTEGQLNRTLGGQLILTMIKSKQPLNPEKFEPLVLAKQ